VSDGTQQSPVIWRCRNCGSIVHPSDARAQSRGVNGAGGSRQFVMVVRRFRGCQPTNRAFRPGRLGRLTMKQPPCG
jgi:hypothetical protein